MKQLTLLFSIVFMSITLNAQSIVGEWETYDDETKKKKSVVTIYKNNDKYYGKITEIIDGKGDEICDKCSGNKKNKPILGLVIIEGLSKDGDEYNDGTILDPESGEDYKCYLELENENKLKVRGFIGFSVFGRTQYWIRKK